MHIDICISGRKIGKMRAFAKRVHLMRLYRALQKCESWHYRCKKTPFGTMPDIAVSFGMGMRIWVTGLQAGLTIDRKGVWLDERI